MANYCCIIRTNYFRVKDPEEFRAFMKRVYGIEDAVQLWEERNTDGDVLFAFGSCGGISGLHGAAADEEDDADESAYDEFISGLQTHVANDDAVLILEAGHEKMRYVVGSATIVTSTDCDHLSITDLAVPRAAAMLGKPDWKTKCEY